MNAQWIVVIVMQMPPALTTMGDTIALATQGTLVLESRVRM
jgi:hypothetical protein